MGRAVGYVRVSSEEQAAHGISVEAQRMILMGWAAMRQYELEIYEDAGWSGKNMDRPALRRMLDAVRAGGAEALVVWKLDRLSRSLRDTLSIIEDELQPRGVVLVSTTENIDTSTPSGRMMLNILASFAQLEREQDSDRVVMAHKHLAHECRYLGGHIALGYRVGADRRLELEPVTAAVARRVFDMYLARCGYAEILAYLNENAKSFKKTPWGKSDLNYLLSNELYAGTYVRRIGADKRSRVTSPETVRVPGGVPAILSPEEWARVCALRESNRTQHAAYAARAVYPLSGLVHCSVCGGLMPLNHGGKARDGTVERYYTCRRHCVKPARLEQIEHAVITAAVDLADHADLVTAACGIANQYAAGAAADRRAEALPAEADLAEVRRQAAKITAWIASDGADAPRTLLDELRRLEAREVALIARIEAARRPVLTYDAARTVAALSAFRGIEKEPPEARRAILQEALSAVLVTDADYQLVLAWHTCGGDDTTLYTCQSDRPTLRAVSPRPSGPLALWVQLGEKKEKIL